MSSDVVDNPLTLDDLKGASFLCTMAASSADLRGGSSSQDHRERRDRFEHAITKVIGGATSLLELGLLADDCKWAGGLGSNYVYDRAAWLSRFNTAERALREAPQP